MDNARVEGASRKDVRHDVRLLADFARIFCDAHHPHRERAPLDSDGTRAGLYGRKRPRLCEECAAHVRYAEVRRIQCPRDPKPFCSYCDTHCYRRSEAEWQREMMRFSGPRSWMHGYAIEGIKHAIAGRRAKREFELRAERRATATRAPGLEREG